MLDEVPECILIRSRRHGAPAINAHAIVSANGNWAGSGLGWNMQERACLAQRQEHRTKCREIEDRTATGTNTVRQTRGALIRSTARANLGNKFMYFVICTPDVPATSPFPPEHQYLRDCTPAQDRKQQLLLRERGLPTQRLKP